MIDSATWDRLAALEDGWDSYGAAAIDPRAIAAAREINTALHVSPCNDGGLNLEAHAAGLDIDLELNPDGTLKSVFVCRVST